MFGKVFFTVLATSVACSFAACPSLWTEFDGTCYRYIGNPILNWQDAEAFCVMEGSHLVSIHSQAEYDFVLTYWRSARDEVKNLDIYPFKGAAKSPFLHIGLNDKMTNGDFVWTDNTEVVFTDWMPRNPTLSETEEGVMIWDRPIPNAGLWNDIPSRGVVLRSAFMCKK
ncbi:hypothetical protein BSL78_01645 [Apostichopus japonicus]|uniref:C-type lectin domain-containing protein n=1 Tax=Stichopus japonicus TaxID=307972 RepID=A0A2G8LMG7_STIJA|nr:hypothetical protein BSL78_01645 [Apostichopus japonicus]